MDYSHDNLARNSYEGDCCSMELLLEINENSAASKSKPILLKIKSIGKVRSGQASLVMQSIFISPSKMKSHKTSAAWSNYE
jgi:hypothetical protein